MSTTRKHDDAELPEGWRSVRLGTFAEIRGGIGFPVERQGRQTGAYPFIKVSDMNLDGNEKFIRFANNYVDDLDAAELGGSPLPEGTVIFPKIGAAIATNKKRILSAPTLIDNNMVGISLPDQATCDSRYLFYWFETIDLSTLANVSAVPSITGSRIKQTPIPLPPLSEQRAIADVLDSIDDAIERTEAVIAATETLRDSLLHELLTRGVPGWHTKWKDVPGIGTIPADWEVVRLGKHVTHVGSGVTPRGGKAVYTESGITFLRSQNVHFDGLRLDDVVHIPQEIDDAMQRSRVKPDDVLLNITGASIGRCTIAPVDIGPANVNQHVCIIRTTEELNPRFVSKWLGTPRSQKEIDDIQTGQSRQGLNYQQVRQLTTVLPPREEQDAVVQILDGVDETIDMARNERDGLRLLKDSTADGLLAGRVSIRS